MSNPLLHTLFCFLFLLPFSTVAQTNGTVDVGASITAGDNSTPWLSPSQDFAFGFKQLHGNNLFLLSIWYYKISERTIVWHANEGVPVSAGSKVEITADEGLVLSDPQGKELWNSASIQVAHGFMNDTGNFVLVGRGSVNLWESFQNPTDTMLPTQIMETGGVLFSRQSERNFSDGRFQLRLLEDGNLVLNTRDVVTNFAYDAYYWSNTYDAVNVTNRGYRVMFYETGYIFVLRRNNQTAVLGPETVPPSGDYYHRATLDFNGVFTHYYRLKTDNATWTILWSEPDNICVDIRANQGRGVCGFNSICTIDDSKRPTCSCPEGFSLLDPNDRYGDCKPNFTQSCEEDDQKSTNGDLYRLSVLTNTDWPLSDYEQLSPSSEELCKNSCLQDCFCTVAILQGDSCWKKKLPLSNGRKDRVVDGKAFMKLRKGDLPPSTPDPDSPFWDKKKNDRTLIIVGSVLLGSSLFINVAILGAFCLGFSPLFYHKMILRNSDGFGVAETNLRCFSYEELAEATNGFKEELGSGAFGIVYGGVVQMGNSRTSVAVKKLDSLVQGNEREKEFRTEVQVIGQTHHRNLVRLVGFCSEGEHRMLVYEFMSNGALASFLFGEMKPNWNQRTEIALGIARGLLYLHDECITQIIHCDIKPHNVLLDDHYNARISDFGLAKLLMINQSHTSTGIRGTRGYVAPEWFRSKPITSKVDVYSFGVVLLEIITCRKNGGQVEMADEERAILTDWVCDCFLEDRLHVVVGDDSEALNDWKKLQRFLTVGIWCIQEDPSLRPTMRKVTQMLEGVVEVPVPPSPSHFSSDS